MTEGEGRLIVGRYRLRRSLGRGGMGAVWLATDDLLGRDVAIKEIRPHGRTLLDTDPEVRRALREARAAAKVSGHPGIVTVHDVVTDDHGLPWIVMQLLNGRSLGTALEVDGPIPVDRAARIGIQVLRALDHAHAANVLHRDVKPGNVMLVEDKAVLTDFGIAVIGGDSVLTATGQLPGAPEYIAPERVLGHEAVPATDVWSVGVMLYHMVVGRSPFRRADIQATLSAALTREPDPDPRVGRLGPVIKGLLRKKPEERMTAEEAIARLTAVAGLPGAAWPAYQAVEDPDSVSTEPFRLPVAPDAPTIVPSVPGRPRSRRGPLIATGVVLAAVIVMVAVVMLVNLPPDRGASPPSHDRSTTNTVALKTYRELGFEIGIPPDWRRASTDGPISDVTWAGTQVDPTVGVLEVQVRRDTTKAGVSATQHLADVARAESAAPDHDDYSPIPSSDEGSWAELEYVYRDVGQLTHYHLRVIAVAAENLYTLTFTLWANDAETLRDRWTEAEPLIAKIRKSFRLVQ